MWSESERLKLSFSEEHSKMLKYVGERLFQDFHLDICKIMYPVEFHAARKPTSKLESVKKLLIGNLSIENVIHPYYKIDYVTDFIKKVIHRNKIQSELILGITNFPFGRDGLYGGFKADPITGVVSAWYHNFNSARVYKESLHELGHIYGLSDCKKEHSDTRCIMNWSIDFDKRLDWYCKRCEDKLKQLKILA